MVAAKSTPLLNVDPKLLAWDDPWRKTLAAKAGHGIAFAVGLDPKGPSADRVALLRFRLRMSLPALAELLGVHSSTISRWEGCKVEVPRWYVGIVDALLVATEQINHRAVKADLKRCGAVPVLGELLRRGLKLGS